MSCLNFSAFKFSVIHLDWKPNNPDPSDVPQTTEVRIPWGVTKRSVSLKLFTYFDRKGGKKFKKGSKVCFWSLLNQLSGDWQLSELWWSLCLHRCVVLILMKAHSYLCRAAASSLFAALTPLCWMFVLLHNTAATHEWRINVCVADTQSLLFSNCP